MILSVELLAAINAHAMAEYPKESCGLIVAGVYVPCFNYAVEPEKDFTIAGPDFIAHAPHVEAVIHSHPDGPLFPTARDMQGQMQTAVPWFIVATDGERCHPPIQWGDRNDIPALVGREFMHGVCDCYSLVRDVFALGRERLAEQDIDWPHPPILMPEVPRDDNWWTGEADLYADHIGPAGFKIVPREDVRPGDGFLAKIRSDKLNHAGVLIGGGLVMHHLPSRLSRREPAGIWSRAAEIWVRFEGAPA